MLTLITHGSPKELWQLVQVRCAKTLKTILELLQVFSRYWVERANKHRQDSYAISSCSSPTTHQCFSQEMQEETSKLGLDASGPINIRCDKTFGEGEQKGTTDVKSAPLLTVEAILLMSSGLLYIQLEVNQQPMRALVDSGASVSIIIKQSKTGTYIPSQTIPVQGYDGKECEHCEWARVKFK